MKYRMPHRLLTVWFCVVSVVSCSPQADKEVVIEPTKAPVTEPQSERLLSFRYELSNPSSVNLADEKVTLAIPISRSSRHQLTNIEVNQDYDLVKDSFGNQSLLLNFDNFSPYSTTIVTVKVTLQLQSNEEKEVANLPKAAISSPFVPFDHPEISLIAKKLLGDNDLSTTQLTYEWVKSYLSYSGFRANDYGALYALDTKSGDCTEYMYLLAALLRANGIDTRLVAGYVYNQNQLVNAADYHNWVEVYINGNWLVVDAQKENFVDNTDGYITMRYLDSYDGKDLDSHRFTSSQNLIVKLF